MGSRVGFITHACDKVGPGVPNGRSRPAFVWASALLLLTTASCTNNALKTAASKGTTQIHTGGDPTSRSLTPGGTGGISTGNSPIVISRVLRSSTSPSNTFDIIGDGSNSIGQYCTDDAATGSSGGSTCSCEYSYIRASGSSESVRVQTSYHEADMLRCRFEVIPADVSYVRIKVLLTSADMYSNELTYRFGVSGTTMNLMDPSSFVSPRRYQCKDVVYIPHVMDGVIYDPLQSEDPAMSYPLNFYTSNMGGAMAYFAAAGQGGYNWECPGTPNDSAAGTDLTVYSERSDGQSNRIYPPAGSAFDRSTFYLAKKSSGLFNVAVNTLLAPGVTTNNNATTAGSAASTGAPPIGFGVAPIPSSNGERCPNSSEVSIPSGFRWVKVWLFRASLTARQAVTSVKFQALSNVACNLGKWSTTNVSIVKDCKDGGVKLDNNTTLADRIIGADTALRCIKFNSPTPVAGINAKAPGYTTYLSGGTLTQRPNPAYFGLFALGTDYWTSYNEDDSQTCDASGRFDPVNLCDESAPNVPHDNNPSLLPVDNGISRFDFLFVVTPETIMVNDMKDLTSDRAKPYRPYRFVPPTSCTSDPDHPVPASDCPAANKVTYLFKEHDISSNGDAPDGQSGRQPVFPVCALQPIN